MKVSTTRRRQKRRIPDWHGEFLNMLPRIQESASFSFRHYEPEARQEALQDITVSALVAFVRLVQLGKSHLAYPTVLAHYGIAQYRCGRRSSSRLNNSDVLSPYAQRQKNFRTEHLHRFCHEQGQWQEILVEDKRATPADVATVRIDFADWLKTLSGRQRRFAKVLATGESTSAVARKFRVSPGRISQIRHELKQSWLDFQGEASSSSPGASAKR